MGDSIASWNGAIRSGIESDQPLLIVCRSTATVREVYRVIAASTGGDGPGCWAGVQVTTLAGLIRTATPERLVLEAAGAEASDLPDGHPWKGRLDGRPRLRRLLKSHMQRVHLLSVIDAPLGGLREELRHLLDAGWGRTAAVSGLERLIGSAGRYGRTISIGFGKSPFSFLGQVSTVERRVLELLESREVDAGAPSHGDTWSDHRLDALRVHDVAAEARAVVHGAGDGGGRTLVLVADEGSEQRIRAACRRNGVPVASDASSPLRHHMLVAILEPFLAVFASRGSAPIAAMDILRLVTSPVLSRTPPGGVFFARVEGIDAPRASVRYLRELVLGCRRARGTLDEWIENVGAQTAFWQEKVESGGDGEIGSERYRLVSGRILMAVLESLKSHASRDGTLGDIAGFVGDLGLAAPSSDHLGHAIIRALRDEGHRGADIESYDDAIEGGISSGRVDHGVQILGYEAYDGRPADRLILTGVHDKGLARAPRPDPFLTRADMEVLGIPYSERAIEERLRLALWAASRAAETLAIVTETDSTGRRVTPPVNLRLEYGVGGATGAYGMSLPLPEMNDCRVFSGGEGERDALCVQIDAEWARAGAVFADSIPDRDPDSDPDTLPEHIAMQSGYIPDDVLPWMGVTGRHPAGEDGLPPGFTLSASKLGGFTGCLYRGCCKSLLGLEATDEDIEEEPDALEAGGAVHRGAERVLAGQDLLVPEKELDKVLARLSRRLAEETASSFGELLDRWNVPVHEVIGASLEGLTGRWGHQWGKYLRGKLLTSVEKASAARRKTLIGEHLASQVEETLAVLGADLANSPLKELRKKLTTALAGHGSDADAVGAEITRMAAKSNQKKMAAVLATPRGRDALRSLCDSAGGLFAQEGFALDGDLRVVATELAFGTTPGSDDGREPVSIRLGRAAVPVHGYIDAVIRRRGPVDLPWTAYRLIDFKTGKTLPEGRAIQRWLTEPQLLLYALVVSEIGPMDDSHPSPVRVETIRYDGPRTLRTVEVQTPAGLLERAREVFGELLDRARDGYYILIPHPEACPLLNSYGRYCDYREICRLRPDFRTSAEARRVES